MKTRQAIRKALEQPWLYEDNELEYMKTQLKERTLQRQKNLWARRCGQGFSNYECPE